MRSKECGVFEDRSHDEAASEKKEVPRTSTNTLGRSHKAHRKPARYDCEARPEDGEIRAGQKALEAQTI